MQGRYNIHRQAATQSRAIHAKYKGQVDFTGGAYGILEGAMKRDLEMEGSDKSRELQQMKLRIESLESENRVRERAAQKTERENKARDAAIQIAEREQALKAKTGVTLQSQVIPNDTQSCTVVSNDTNKRTISHTHCLTW